LKAARTKLGGSGQVRVKEYLICSLQSLADDKVALSPESIRALVAGHRSKPIAVTDNYWQKKIARYKARNRSHRSTADHLGSRNVAAGLRFLEAVKRECEFLCE
jgi:hypothetical protein